MAAADLLDLVAMRRVVTDAPAASTGKILISKASDRAFLFSYKGKAFETYLKRLVSFMAVSFLMGDR
jgi:hypothetical protein